jgi:hypothetical protein
MFSRFHVIIFTVSYVEAFRSTARKSLNSSFGLIQWSHEAMIVSYAFHPRGLLLHFNSPDLLQPYLEQIDLTDLLG